MHVGLNLIFLVPGETGGMEVAARELIPALRDAAPGVRFTAFVNREAAGEDLGVETGRRAGRRPRRVEWVRGEQQLLPRLARRAGCDLVHSLASTAPARGPLRPRHDDPRPQLPRRARRALRRCAGSGMRVLVPLAARTSHRVIADSEATRADLVERLRVPAGEDRRRAARARPAGRRTPTPGRRAARAARRSATRPVVLSLSAKRPHKNLRGLLDALALIPTERRPVLVLPGYPTPHEAELRAHAAALGVDGDVRFLGWTAEADLEGLFALSARVRVPVALRGLRAAGAGGDGARRARSRARTARRCPRWPATPRCCSTRTDPARDRRGARAAARRPGGGRAPARRGARAGGAVHLGARGGADARELRARAAARRSSRRRASSEASSESRRALRGEPVGRRGAQRRRPPRARARSPRRGLRRRRSRRRSR